MEIVDYKIQLKKFYKPSAHGVELVEVTPINYLMIDGQGHPDSSQDFLDAGEALVAVSVALKAIIKRGDLIDYGIMPLEVLWWSKELSRFSVERKHDWNWTLMMMQPSPVTIKRYETALAPLKAKGALPALEKIRFESLREERTIQKLHVGPFTELAPAIKSVHDRMDSIGAKLSGKFHEIYLSDMKKATPDKWKTILRQPYI